MSGSRPPARSQWHRSRGLDLPGLDMVISSDVPLRSGLSSSAALTVAVAVAVNDLSGTDLSARRDSQGGPAS